CFRKSLGNRGRHSRRHPAHEAGRFTDARPNRREYSVLSHLPRQRCGIGWVAAAGGRALLVPTLDRTRGLLPFASGHEVTSKGGRYGHQRNKVFLERNGRREIEGVERRHEMLSKL